MMDIVTIRTFLAVSESGSFVAAADKVNVAQSTVSMRIRTLEEKLGSTLFERNKQGARLTAAGHEFLKHAISITRTWDQARFEVGLGDGQAALLRVGAQLSLWSGYLLDWLTLMREQEPTISISAEIGHIDELTVNLTSGTLDLAVLYRPHQRAGFQLHKLFDEEIALFADPSVADQPFGQHYVYVNWGPEFQRDHALNFAGHALPTVSLDLGPLGVDYLVQAKKAGYFPRRMAASRIETGQLQEVQSSPVFSYPVYGVYPETIDPEILKTIIHNLNRTTSRYRKDFLIR